MHISTNINESKANSLKSSSRPRSDHSYVNLNQTHSGSRVPSYQESSINSKISNNQGSLPSPRINVSIVAGNLEMNSRNGTPFQSNPSIPQNWYSPPASVKSVSRPASAAIRNDIIIRNPSKVNSTVSRLVNVISSVSPKTIQQLETIDEDGVVVSVDKLLKLCSYPNEVIQANALGYLQHLTYNNPKVKMQVRDSNGLPIIMEQIDSANNFVASASLRVLKNMSFTDLEMITTEIADDGGIQKLLYIIYSTEDFLQKELAIDIIWNLSVKYNLKPLILKDVVPVLLTSVIIPNSGMLRQEAGNYVEGEDDIAWSTMLRNALGIIRNVSYEDIEARTILRKSDGLIDCILYIIFKSGNRDDDEELEESQLALIDTKIVENCVCILRNITYAIQEIIDSDYLAKRQNPDQKANKPSKKENKDQKKMIAPPLTSGVPKGAELLWNSKYIVTALLPIMKNAANAVTLEAAAGVTQNLTAGDWEPSKEMQIQFRLQLALPALIELIDFGTNEVIRSAATALRNLVQDYYCRMLIGKNGLQHLTDKIPMSSHSKNIAPSALAAILSTIYVIIFDEVEFMKIFVINKGGNRCLFVRDSDEYIMNDDPFPDKVNIFSQCILNLLWKTSSIQDFMKKENIKQSDINTPNNLSRSVVKSSVEHDAEYSNRILHASMVSDQHDVGRQYPRDERYLRDSMADIVSNNDLRQRTSVAYTTSSVPGYGDVRLAPSKLIISNGQGHLHTIRSESRVSSKASSNNNRIKTPVPSYHTRDSLHSANSCHAQTSRGIPLNDLQSRNSNVSVNNRRSSNNGSHSSRTPINSRGSKYGKVAVRLPSNSVVSVNNYDSNPPRAYSKVIKPKPIQDTNHPRVNGHGAI